HDITEHKRREADAWRQANYDSLTTLANRNYFLQQLSARLTRAKHTGGQFAVMLLDLDQFKEVNDSLGHSQGDSLLVHVAQRLVHVLRDTDLVGRLGGDEFAIIVEFSTIEQLDPLLTRLLSEIEQPVDLHQAQVSVSASIGVAVFPDDGDTPGELLSHADEAMYHVKGRGRAGYSFYSSKLSELTKRRLRLASDLRAAIGTEQISVVYQPVVSAHYNRIVGAEALCRWSHPELGEIPPSEFIPLAEQTGLIQRLEDWILDTVLQQLVQINNLNVSPVRISVNISPLRIMREPKRLSELAAELDSLGVYPSQLVIEVTEGLLLEATEEVLELFDILNKQGLVISLDDFGTGYCALSYLMHLNIQQVKIDRSFVERIDRDANSQALCASIISLAKTLGLSVVAEGVEEEVQRDLLSGLGCDYYQGFLFSKPLKPEVLMQKLAEQRQHEELVLTGDGDSANL
ncbi:MAG: EAL domain-containing protein, partial [Oceanospirillaceae bacterium]|nr:EAL domain-containing protein [Oceanospirillaceae bacterium]